MGFIAVRSLYLLVCAFSIVVHGCTKFLQLLSDHSALKRKILRLFTMDSLTLSTAKIANGAIVCCECELLGDITIGSRTVIHPRAKIIALYGPIIIGENNIIEEQVQIINNGENTMIIGNNNVFEVDCRVESKIIGDNNIVESKAFVGRQTSLSNGCVIGAKCEVLVPETLQEGSLFYGAGSDVKRRVQSDKPSAQGAQIEFLSKVLPNYHRIRKPLI